MQQAAVNFAGRALGDQPAHPYTEHNDDGSHYYDNSGLTKRELIAAMAMQGVQASVAMLNADAPTNYELVAEIAVAQADALLAELAKDGEV